MEYLSLLVEQEVRSGCWKAIKIGKQGPQITHSLFSDNIVLFGMDDGSTIGTIQCVLHNFFDIPG